MSKTNIINRNTYLNTIRSATCTGSFYLWAILIGILMIPMSIFLPRSLFRIIVVIWSVGNMYLLRIIAGIKVDIQGLQNIPQGPVIIAAKHQSEWETIILLHVLHDPVYVLKKELAFIPGFGQYAYKMGMIFIDRKGHAQSLRHLLVNAKHALKNIGKETFKFYWIFPTNRFSDVEYFY